MALTPYTRNLRQKATYWAPAENDGFGNVGFLPPVEIKCRWQDVAKLFRSADGKQLTSSSIVYVDRHLERQGYLALGTQLETVDPRELGDAKEILQLGSSPSLSATLELLKVWL